MKHKLWLINLPVVAAATFLFWVTHAGIMGELHHPWLRSNLFPQLRTYGGRLTDLKFRIRGPEEPKNKVVIVAIDEEELQAIGRWPWHRDQMARLIDRLFMLGAKVVGLDMVFAEADQRVSKEAREFLEGVQLGGAAEAFETDSELVKTIEKHKDRLVLGWVPRSWCQSAYQAYEECPATAEEVTQAPPGFERAAYDSFVTKAGFDPQKNLLLSALIPIPNLDIFTRASQHAGYFLSWPDKDSVVRRFNLAMFVGDRPYPSLPMAMARAGLKKKIALSLDGAGRIASLGFEGDARPIPVTALGVMDINFRGPARTFPYVGANQVLEDQVLNPERIAQVDRGSRGPASAPLREVLQDAYVLIGATAVGINDIRAFPFDEYMPGTEGLATILDNLLSMDMLTRGTGGSSTAWIFVLMTVGALLLAYGAERLESVPALLLFAGTMTAFAVVDVQVFFKAQRVDLPTALFYTEMSFVFVLTLAAKYVVEERNKKFIRGAFSKYVAPTIVDSILKDPTKLTVGGEKRELTILFSDIRGFTTFSEAMDAPRLAKFLNDYLGIMTEIVFECEGTLDKYIGDAVMAFWGAPLDQPKHAQNACRAAIRMQQAVRENQPRWKEQYGVDVEAGIGINSGPVNVGNMGSDRIFEYTVIGDHVNLASRLEGLTKYYGVKIVTTRFTFDAIHAGKGEEPPYRVLDFVKVKGKKKAVELLEVLDRDFPKEGLELFARARQLYTQQKWDEAIALFREANQILGHGNPTGDYPSRMYEFRCEQFKETPPEADWDGSWEMTSK